MPGTARPPLQASRQRTGSMGAMGTMDITGERP
jgi:hypothetical protein